MAPSHALAGYCEERHRLLNEFAEAVTELVMLHEKQVLALIDGTQAAVGVELLIHKATERKLRAKVAYMGHLDAHGCGPQTA